jgi:hypothetical protein
MLCVLTSVHNGVLITPGATAVTRIPTRASNGARQRTNPEMPYFEAMYYIPPISHLPHSSLNTTVGTCQWSQGSRNLTGDTRNVQNIAWLFLLEEVGDCKLGCPDRMCEIDIQQLIAVSIDWVFRL